MGDKHIDINETEDDLEVLETSVIIEIEGGLVSSIECSDSNAKILVIDRDIEEEEDGSVRNLISWGWPDTQPNELHNEFKDEL